MPVGHELRPGLRSFSFSRRVWPVRILGIGETE